VEQASRLAEKTKIFDAIWQPSFFLKKEFIDAFVLLFDCVEINPVPKDVFFFCYKFTFKSANFVNI
jgi:hypothetical protein